jgi:hypothetical protein
MRRTSTLYTSTTIPRKCHTQMSVIQNTKKKYHQHRVYELTVNRSSQPNIMAEPSPPIPATEVAPFDIDGSSVMSRTSLYSYKSRSRSRNYNRGYRTEAPPHASSSSSANQRRRSSGIHCVSQINNGHFCGVHVSSSQHHPLQINHAVTMSTGRLQP